MTTSWWGQKVKEENGGEATVAPDVQMEADVTFNLEFVPRWLENTVVSTVVVFEQLNVQEPARVVQG